MNKRERHYFRIHEPYCLQQVERGQYIKLNRDYKPVGMGAQETMSLPGLTPQVAAALSDRGSDDVDAVYLYNDGCVPTSTEANMRAYMTKLALLSKVEVAARPKAA